MLRDTLNKIVIECTEGQLSIGDLICLENFCENRGLVGCIGLTEPVKKILRELAFHVVEGAELTFQSVDVLVIGKEKARESFVDKFSALRIGGYFLFLGYDPAFLRDRLSEDQRLSRNYFTPALNHDNLDTSVAVFFKRMERA